MARVHRILQSRGLSPAASLLIGRSSMDALKGAIVSFFFQKIRLR